MKPRFGRREEILAALFSEGKERERLFDQARKVRDEIFRGRVEVRSVIEYANICRQECKYCGMNRGSALPRYCLSEGEFLRRARGLYHLGRRVILVQSGECGSDQYFRRLCSALRRVRDVCPHLTLMGCFGSLEEGKYRELRAIGMERYLLKFETSDPALYAKVKPGDSLGNRLSHIRMLKRLGFKVSSGNITGLPGQTRESLADDILLLKELDIPMGSTSVFIPNEMSEFAACPVGDVGTALNFTAVLRLVCPWMVIPTTSSLELAAKGGQGSGLAAGANSVTLHDGTPSGQEKKYVIYRKNRYTPKGTLLSLVRDAGLEPCAEPLTQGTPEESLFHALVSKNLGRKNPAVFCDGKRYTYDDIESMTAFFCSFLRAQGLGQGDRVIISLPDSVEFIVAFLSCVRMGIVSIPVDPAVSEREWALILEQTRPCRVFTTESICRRQHKGVFAKIASDDSPEYFLSLLRRQPRYTAVACPDPKASALVLFTSGSTGSPKGVVHCWKSLFTDTFPRTVLKMSGRDRIFSCSRLCTSFGLGNSLLFPFLRGAGVILSRTIPVGCALDNVLRLRPTMFFAVPSMYDFLLRDPVPEDAFASVRVFVSSGEKLYDDTARRWSALYGKRLLDCFGATELCHSFIVGTPLRGFSVKVGVGGVLSYRGPSLFMGYLGDAGLTAKRLRGGWYRSDDRGEIDGRGRVIFKGRSGTLVKSGGSWVNLLEIENTLRKNPLVRAAVVATQRGGLTYFITLRPPTIDPAEAEKKIRGYCAARLSLPELPKKILFVKDFTGKWRAKLSRDAFLRDT